MAEESVTQPETNLPEGIHDFLDKVDFVEDDEPTISSEDEEAVKNAVESVTGEEVEDEKKEEEEPKEEAKEEVKESPELLELQTKFKKAEKRLKMAQAKAAEFEAKVKEREDYISTLKGEGVNAEIAKELVVAKKVGDYHKLFELVGIEPNAVIKDWCKTAGLTPEQTEEVTISLKRKAFEEESKRREAEIESKRKEAEAKEREATGRDLNVRTEKFIQKYADKLVVCAHLEDKAVDLMRQKVGELVSAKDPRVASCKTYEEAMKIAAPIVERQLRKEAERAYEAFSKVKGKTEKESAKSTESKKEEPEKVEKKSEEKKSSATVKGSGKPSPTPAKKLTEHQKLQHMLRELDF